MGGAVLKRALESQHNIAGAVEFEPFIGDGGSGDVVALLFKFVALIHGAAHLGVEAESLFTDTAFLGVLHVNAGDRFQAQYFLARPGFESDAVGVSGRLQWRYGGTRIGFGQVEHPLLFNEIASAGQ